MSIHKGLSFMIQAVNKTAEPFAEVENGIERLNQATARASTLVFAEQRAQDFLIATYRQKYSAVYDTLGLMRGVGTVGGQIITMVNAQNIAQIRLRDSLIDVEDAQLRLNTALGLFGEDSVQYEDALNDLEAANRRAEDAQDANEKAMFGIGLQAIGTAAHVGDLIMSLGGPTGLLAALSALALAHPAGIAIAITLVGVNVFHEQLDEIDRRVNLTRMALEGRLADVEELKDAIGKVRPGLGYYDPDELAKDLGYDPETGEPYAAGTVDPDMPEIYRDVDVSPTSDPYTDYEREKIDASRGAGSTTNIEVNVETNADPDQIADAVERVMHRHNREVL